MTESDFVNSIDGKFPYQNEGEWRPLIELGASISPNAAFMVLHEICRLPAGVGVARSDIKAMLDFWIQHFKNPLVAVVLTAARALIEGSTIPVDQTRNIMQAVRSYRDQHNALSIAYFAGYDAEGTIDGLYDEIVNAWKGA